VKLYQLVEERMTNDSAFANPFTDTELRLAVRAPVGRKLGTSFTWYGFFDGEGAGGQRGNVWKFRLLLDHPGRWVVAAGFYVPGTSTPNGGARTFIYHVSPPKVPGEHGHIRVDPENPRRFRYDDGTPWVPFVMHSSMLLDREWRVARRWIDEHAARGVDALAVRFHAEAWVIEGKGRWHFLLKDGRRADVWPESADAFDYSRFDLATWHYNERAIQYARSKGVKLSIWFGISGINRQYWSYGPKDNPDNRHLGPLQKLFIRYFLARWAPYTNWWHWTVDSEYEETGSGALDRIRAYAAELRAKNPWRTMITTHVLRDWSPNGAPEFDLATLQRRVADTDEGASECRQFITENDRYHMPVYNAEGVWNLATLTRTRVATWAHLFAGGFSKAAFYLEDREGPQFSSWGVTWDSVAPAHKEAAALLGRLSRFFNKTPGIDISRCVPHNELVAVEGGHLALCLADPGRSYYVWADQGGTLSLDLSGVTGSFTVKRYRCADLDRWSALPTLPGGRMHRLDPTPSTGSGSDYLFVIQKGSKGNHAPTKLSGQRRGSHDQPNPVAPGIGSHLDRCHRFWHGDCRDPHPATGQGEIYRLHC